MRSSVRQEAARRRKVQMKQDELIRKVSELTALTKAGKIRWSLEVQTTEANDAADKPKEVEQGVEWTIDECYVSYYCSYQNKEFCMITYERLKTAEDSVRSGNMVFVPPLGVRYFDLRTLLPYNVDASAVLLEQIHQLWVLLMDMHKADKESIQLEVKAGKTIMEA